MAHFSVNKIINRIIITLDAYDSGGGTYPFKDKCHNHFGNSTSNIDQLLRQNEHIYIFYGGENPRPLANKMMEDRLWLEFWVVDQIMGVDSTKSDFQADKLRLYLMSGGWRNLGIETDYGSMNPRPFIVDEISPTLWLDERGNPTGYMIAIFRGYVDFDSIMS